MKTNGPKRHWQQYQTTWVRGSLAGPCAIAVAVELGAEVFSLAAARFTGIASAFWVVATLFVVVVDVVFMVAAGSVPVRCCWHKWWMSAWKLTVSQSSAYSPPWMTFKSSKPNKKYSLYVRLALKATSRTMRLCMSGYCCRYEAGQEEVSWPANQHRKEYLRVRLS